MRTIHRLIEAKKAEREENGEAGFSLIELIVVVVIIGILAAVAIPIFNGVQESARVGAAKSAATSTAIAVGGAISKGGTAAAIQTAIDAAVAENATDKITLTDNNPTKIETICVTATHADGGVWSAGNGAKADGSGCK